MGDSYERHLDATGGYLVARSFQSRFQKEWFDPEFWSDLAVPITKGGRGSAWFITSNTDDLVLRHFCRGGVPGRFLRRDYLYTRADAVRSFSEFRLLDTLYHEGLPVPEPLAAGYRRRGLVFYHAAIIIRRIPGANPLSEFVSLACRDAWRSAGACVRRFHDAGVFHADLNCMNILVSDQVYLIDFDRGRIMNAGGRNGWKASNISRLKRSVDKSLGHLSIEHRAQLWGAFLSGYRND